MPIPFDKYDYLKIGDLERCPYIPKDYQYAAWHRDDDRRMLLIALERYAEAITAERIWRRNAWELWNSQQE